MPSKPCVTCVSYKPIFANGECRDCYAEWGIAHGLSESELPPSCSVDGCADYADKRGMCDKHYRRFIKYGHTDKIRQQGMREIRKHSEYKNWIHLKSICALVPEWFDFEVFIVGIGERPSDRHRLVRLNRDELMGPDNFEWHAAKFETVFSTSTVEGRKEYNRAAYVARSIVTDRPTVGSGLSRFYGMSTTQYEQLLAKQSGTCALCDATHDMDSRGRVQALSVDHDHETHEVRGLLCRNHNVMLGLAKDNSSVLRKAVEYLERGTHTGWFAPAAGDPPLALPVNRRSPAKGKVCEVGGCDNAVKSKNLCTIHYARFLRNGHVERLRKEIPQCSIDDCNQRSVARGYCRLHYNTAFYSKRPKADNPTPS